MGNVFFPFKKIPLQAVALTPTYVLGKYQGFTNNTLPNTNIIRIQKQTDTSPHDSVCQVQNSIHRKEAYKSATLRYNVQL